MCNDIFIERKSENVIITPRQKQVLLYLMQGMQNKEIAFEMGLSEATIKLHLARIYEKLGAKNRVETLMIVLKSGLFE